MSTRTKSAAAFRGELPDGSRIEQAYRVETLPNGKERRVGRGNWQWCVYHPDRRPTRKRVNLRTKDKGAAMGLALDMARDYSLGSFDPWKQSAAVGVTMTKAAAEYGIAQARAGRAETTILSGARMLTAFSKSLPVGASVEHITAEHVEAFVSAPKPRPKGQRTGIGAPKSAGTRRRYVAVLGHFFDWCVERGYTRVNPAAPVSSGPMKTNRRDHVTELEAAAMLRALDAAEVTAGTVAGPASVSWVRDWFVFGLGTGLRPGEQRALRWSDVRLDGGGSGPTVRVRGTKTEGSSRPVPVAGDALRVLRRLVAGRADEAASAPVFVAPRGGLQPLDFLSKRLQKLAAEAGVEKNITAYSLRHSYGTRMAAAGVPLLDLARIMGTSVAMIERHYGHYDPTRGASHVARVFGMIEALDNSAERLGAGDGASAEACPG